MTLLAFLAVAVIAGTWLGIRLAEESQHQRDFVALVLSTPLPDEDLR